MVLWLMSEVIGLAACLDSQEGFIASEYYLSCRGGQRLKLAVRKKTSYLFINKSKKMQQLIKMLLFHIYMKLNMFRATHRPSSGA